MRIGYSFASVNSLIFFSSVIVGRPVDQPSLRHAREVSATHASKSDSLAELAPAAIVTLADGVPGAAGNRDTSPENAVDSVCIYVVNTENGVEPLAVFCRGSVETPLMPSSSSSPSGGETQDPTDNPGDRTEQTRSPVTSSVSPSSSGTTDASPPVITSQQEPAPVRVPTATARRCGSNPFPPYSLSPESSNLSPPTAASTRQTSEISPSTPAAFFTIPPPIIPLSPTDASTSTDNLRETATETVTVPPRSSAPTEDPTSPPSPSPSFSSSNPSRVDTLPGRQTITPSATTTSRPATATALSSSISGSSGGINIVPVAR